MSETAVYLFIHNLLVRLLVLELKTSSFPFYLFSGEKVKVDMSRKKAQMAKDYSSFLCMKLA